MNEHELRNALRNTMATSSPPPSMDPAAVVESGRKAERTRRTTVGAGVVGLVVVAIAVGTTLLPGRGADGSQVQVAASRTSDSASVTVPATPETTITEIPTTAIPSTGSSTTGRSTKPSWPDGQTDRTATSGPRADKAVGLLNELSGALPTGVRDVDKPSPDPRFPLRRPQAQFEDYVGDLQVWEYQGVTPVEKDGVAGVGRVLVQVETKGNTRLDGATGCAGATRFPYPVAAGTCEFVTVDGKQVAVVTGPAGDDQYEQAAFHWHADGTLVVVAQSRAFPHVGLTALADLPLSGTQLAALATRDGFHLA
ncbi:hypothetical protein GCM10022243_33750 [Saccharothrix violaceirubra]|uniref:Uncharacterized protein n=1 Tax=Saccharothrix violaceirubra TaxID=413306 RepID=A0A7W7T0B0_9PSEU|nr:hypothetical protein [Saccharothrix violaceirubra]MBB4964224.1 hypothetical protein [Saccharothrix violaceirubra]